MVIIYDKTVYIRLCDVSKLQVSKKELHDLPPTP